MKKISFYISLFILVFNIIGPSVASVSAEGGDWIKNSTVEQQKESDWIKSPIQQPKIEQKSNDTNNAKFDFNKHSIQNENFKVIPSLSTSTVKNGETLTITTLILAQNNINTVEATIVKKGEQKSLATLSLKKSSGTTKNAVYTVAWKAKGLTEGNYNIKIKITDTNKNQINIDNLTFTDPIAGISQLGAKNSGAKSLDKWESTNVNAWRFSHLLIDNTGTYGIVASNSGLISKIDLATLNTIKTINLHQWRVYIKSGVIDNANQSVYYAISDWSNMKDYKIFIIKIDLTTFTKVDELIIENKLSIQHTTMYIKNKRNSSSIKICSSLEPSCKLKVLCFEIGNFSYTHR